MSDVNEAAETEESSHHAIFGNQRLMGGRYL